MSDDTNYLEIWHKDKLLGVIDYGDHKMPRVVAWCGMPFVREGESNKYMAASMFAPCRGCLEESMERARVWA